MRKIKELWYPQAEEAVEFDFDNVTNEDGDYRYNTWEAVLDEATGRWVGGSLLGDRVTYKGRWGDWNGDVTRDQDALLDDNDQTPTSNNWWKFGGLDFTDEWSVAWAVRHLPLVLVEIDSEYGFALTGGGMDMSWYIAGAFALANYTPPLSVMLRDYEFGVTCLGERLARRTKSAYHESLRREKRRINHRLAELRSWS